MRKLAIFSAAFALAAAVYVYLFQDVRALWLAGAFLLLSPVCRWLRLRRMSIACLGLVIGILWCFSYQQLFLKTAEQIAGTEQTVTVTLTEQPRMTDYGASARCSLEGIEAVLYEAEALSKASAGDLVTCTARIEKTGLRIQDGESLYLRSNGVVLCLYAQSELSVETGTPSVPVRLRTWLQSRIHALYQGDTAAFVRALLTGDRSELPYAIENDLSVSGISHAIAVSGMHVSMLLTMLAFFCGKQPRIMALAGIPLVCFFALLTGASASVCRAAVMQAMLLAAFLVHRDHDVPTALGASALLLLLQNPWAVASVSFQLSFAAVAGLLLFSGRIQERLLGKKKNPGAVRRALASSVSATFGASILTLPLTMLYFQMVSIAAPLTNLLVLWAITAIFTLGLLSCLLGPVGTVLAWPVGFLTKGVLVVCRWIAAQPYAAADAQYPFLMLWAVCAYLAALVLLLAKRKVPVLGILCGMTAAFLLCITLGRLQLTAGELSFTALDVGQGQCLLLESQGFTAMVDCGGSNPEEAGERAARKLHGAGMTRLDVLVLTHYDLDHVGGVPQLLYRVQVDSLFLSDTPDEIAVREELEAAARETGCRVFYVKELVEVAFPAGKLLLYPPVSRENDNNSGICVLASAAEYDILITGDLDQLAEMRLLSTQSLPQVELLVAGHHGAETSTSQVLLETVRPEAVVISVGADNAYGHPAAQTLQRIEQSGAELYRTDLMGTITLRR